jgi:hypothetical protein
MPKSYIQTVEIYYPKSEFTFYSMEPIPVNNRLYAKAFLDTEDGSKTEWFDEYVKKIYVNDTVKCWYHKPTLNVVLTTPGNGTYTQFYKDGSVIQKLGQNTYHWSTEFVDLPEPVGSWSKCFCCYHHDGDSD